MRAAIVTLVAVASCHGGDKDEPPRTKPMPHIPTTYLVLRVTDGGKPVAARVLLVGEKGEPLHMGNLDVYGRRQGGAACAIAPGVIASWDGLILGYGAAEVPVGADSCRPSPAIPYGRYHVWAWRGLSPVADDPPASVLLTTMREPRYGRQATGTSGGGMTP